MSRSNQDVDINEQSPLIAAEDTGVDEDVEDRVLSDDFGLQDSTVEHKSTLHLILLTLSIGGLQVFWSLEFSNGSPYLLSLGMSKALLALVWLAGPLTGVLVQPYIGIISDRCQSPMGKRKPFIIGGTIGTVISSLLLSYSKDIVYVFDPWAVQSSYGGWWKGLTITFATIMMWCLDFSINTAQAAIRALIVDGAPAHQQESANAWASRITGVGNVSGYIFGYLNLARYFQFFGNTQFKVLCVVASMVFSTTVLITVVFVKERNPRDEPASRSVDETGGVFSFFRQVFTSITRMPPQIKSVCKIQFVYWMAWFPFLFYITTYIGQLYANPLLQPGMTIGEIDAVWEKATRVGTLALLIYAIISFGANMILPFLVVPSYTANDDHQDLSLTKSNSGTSLHGGTSYSQVAQYDGSYASQDVTPRVARNKRSSISKHLGHSKLDQLLQRLQIPGLTLRRAWLSSQILYAFCMFSTFFISSPLGASIMVAVAGLPWALTLWAPFALISGEIAKRDELRRDRYRQKLLGGRDEDIDADKLDEQEDRAGIILGIHNVAVSAPQIIATLISSAIFKALQKDRGTPGDVSVSWTLRLAGIAALGAAFLTYRMKEPSDESLETARK